MRTCLYLMGLLVIGVLSQGAAGENLGLAPTVFERQPLGSAEDFKSVSEVSQWELSGGDGARQSSPDQPGTPTLRVTGDGTNCNFWFTLVDLPPSQLYRIRFQYRTTPGTTGGTVIAGPEHINRDLGIFSSEWQTAEFVFVTANDASKTRFRLGQWHLKGSVEFREPRLIPVLAVHQRQGAGQVWNGTEARFVAPLGGEASNYSRPLFSFTARFNTNRWCIEAGQEVVYRHEVDRTDTELAVQVNVWDGQTGKLLIEAKNASKPWAQIGTIERKNQTEVKIDDAFLPPTEESDKGLYIRLRTVDGGVVVVDGYQFKVKRACSKVPFSGRTVLLDVESRIPGLEVHFAQMGLPPTDEGQLRMSLKQESAASRELLVSAAFGESLSHLSSSDPVRVMVPAQGSKEVAMTHGYRKAGKRAGRIEIRNTAGNERAVFVFQSQISVLYAADYGQMLEDNSHVQLWWCEAGRKVARTREAPNESGEAVRIEAARGEFEAAQVVVRAKEPGKINCVKASELTGSQGEKISASQVQVLKVGYVRVQVPTDALGVADEWPDPLPPINGPISVDAGNNQPLWILVQVPADAAAGEYAGQVRIEADHWSATVPLKVRVWDFSLPETTRVQSGFGLDIGLAYKYQNVSKPQDRRQVWEKYMQSFADHRISPYDPTGGESIDIKFDDKATPPRAILDWTRFDKAMTEAVERWHITAFQLQIPATGGGTFHSRVTGEINGHPAGSPKYEAMFGDMLRQIESHLEEKGWLDKAYVYWFDEPEPKDYPFVREVMERMKKYAPKIRLMLTEEPVSALRGPVDLWCPLTPTYNHDMAEKCRADGDQFWWYVCCGPHEPYCTLFIDHPATDLRAWLWQTWQRKIDGILIWATNYWTSGTAFPDSLQNPYEDSMSYMTGYGTPSGTKSYWGNGDGRLIYPPPAAAGGATEPILEGPVSSIRWEMLRDGVEDVDYLYRLKDRIAEVEKQRPDHPLLAKARELLVVPAAISASVTEYAYEPTPMDEHRRSVARMIEELGN